LGLRQKKSAKPSVHTAFRCADTAAALRFALAGETRHCARARQLENGALRLRRTEAQGLMEKGLHGNRLRRKQRDGAKAHATLTPWPTGYPTACDNWRRRRTTARRANSTKQGKISHQ